MTALIRAVSIAVAVAVLAVGADAVVNQLAAQRTVHINTGCNNCHQLHGSGGPVQLLPSGTVEDLCLSCHTPGANPDAPEDVAVHTSPQYAGGATVATCVDCHGHPGDAGGNLAFIRQWLGRPPNDTIPSDGAGNKDLTLPVVFTSRGTDAVAPGGPSWLPGAGPAGNSFADEDAGDTYDGVCEVCHEVTDRYQQDGGGAPHNTGLQCTKCHLHDDGNGNAFQGGGPCVTCHDVGGDGTAALGRAIFPEFNRKSHHVQFQSGVAADSVLETDCTACHNQDEHQQGKVRLQNADNATVYEFGTDDLAPFCLSCHDLDGAGGSNPFHNDVAPPIVDATDWAAASHNTDYTCLDCHETPHGSEKQRILGSDTYPADEASTSADTLFQEEEGFCFQCHDGSPGPDVETTFDVPIRWAQDDAGDNGNANLNDRHDVQYEASARSAAKIECYNCHDPHTANATNKLKADPDPSDGRIPGEGNTLGSGTFMSEWCLDCHDGSFPVGVTDHSPDALINVWSIYDTVTNAEGNTHDSHGEKVGGSNTIRPPSDGYGTGVGITVQCMDCHAPHNGARVNSHNLFQMKDVVMSLIDGITPIPSAGSDTIYSLTDNDVSTKGQSPTTYFDYKQGYYYCNTCHDGGSMGTGKSNCQQCHNHRDGRF